jgi:hypothetical protein
VLSSLAAFIPACRWKSFSIAGNACSVHIELRAWGASFCWKLQISKCQTHKKNRWAVFSPKPKKTVGWKTAIQVCSEFAVVATCASICYAHQHYMLRPSTDIDAQRQLKAALHRWPLILPALSITIEKEPCGTVLAFTGLAA